MANFTELGISEELIKGLNENNILSPTEIQEKSIPFLLNTGTDFIGLAQTGTGKTAAFGLPLLQKTIPGNDKINALILCPTRELGQQIAKQLFRISKYATSKIFIEAVYGGTSIDAQISQLRRPTHIVVATPGRLIDLLERKAIDLSHIKTLVLDEADEMLSMGFQPDIDRILKYTNGIRKTWLFSATMSDEIMGIINTYMSPDAFRVQVDKINSVNANIQHQYVVCHNDEKFNTLIRFLKLNNDNRGIVFCKTKVGAQTLAKQLISKNYAADAIHGDLFQRDRDKVMRAFKNKKLQILVATDMAARGIDVENLSYVIHYNLPEQLDYYTHRSGRTARAGKTGLSISLVSNSELGELKKIENKLSISFKNVQL